MEAICAPEILPTNAWSMEAVGAAGSLSDDTDSTEMPKRLLLVAAPTPVTTTSLRERVSDLMVIDAALEAGTSVVKKPTAETISMALGLTLMLN
jgi:hypothetical protein